MIFPSLAFFRRGPKKCDAVNPETQNRCTRYAHQGDFAHWTSNGEVGKIIDCWGSLDGHR